MRGKFIVFEGIDGAGKTTQVDILAAKLRAEGKQVVITAEPTAFESGKRLRQALSGKIKKSECEMAVMFVADRIEHNIHPTEGIKALVESGAYVLCDRYYYSTLAYQGQSTDYAWVKAMNLGCPEICRPDICVYLDLTPEQSLERISRGRESVEIYENLETLTKVRNTFLAIIDDLTAEGDRIVTVNAYGTVEEISEKVYSAVCDAE